MEGLSLLVKGKVQPSFYREGQFEFKVKSIYLLVEAREELINSVSLIIPITDITPEFIEKLTKVSSAKGKVNFKIHIFDPEEKYSVDMFSRKKTFKLSDKFLDFVNSEPHVELMVK